MEHTTDTTKRARAAWSPPSRWPALVALLGLVAALGCGGGGSYVGPGVGMEPYGEAAYQPAGAQAEYEALSEEGGAYMYRHTPPVPEAGGVPGTEQYAPIEELGFRSVEQAPLSTFSVDVDTASYSNVRRFLMGRTLPPPDAVRIEELINYFGYAHEAPSGEHPIAITTELSDSPFSPHRKLLRIGLSARDRERVAQPAKNLVFLVDVSGSMADANKLPLLKRALSLLVKDMNAHDRIAIVTYAGSTGVALQPTRGDRREEILEALHWLESGGSTHGSAGIELAYGLAARSFRPGAVNRVILATDGDFNVGVTDRGSLKRLIERERERGIFLTVLGFGMGNYKDATMETLADAGNGNYAYIDTLREARKVLVEEAGATLVTVAKDTKIQVELNPARVARYRLIGYDNRRLADEDFNDDRKDAGDMGDGHTVTALYELELRGDGGAPVPTGVDPLRYQEPRLPSEHARSDELLTVKVRYKTPEAHESRLLSRAVRGEAVAFDEASEDMRFAAAVAGFGMLLRGSEHAGHVTLADVERMAEQAVGRDDGGYRRELVQLVHLARGMARE